jgi:pimeloyl-ACP methyl ester carboxylesterase
LGIATITANAAYNSLLLIRTDFGYTCGTEIITDFLQPLPRPVTFQAKLSTCITDKVPVLFVPGYGTSINLKFLSKSTSTTNNADWHFSKLLSESYFTFLDVLSAQHIPFEIAYYDWRLPATEAAERYLVPALERLKKKTGSKSVNIVAHSFGGVVSRAYIQSPDYQGDVLNFTTLGTPHRGAAKAYSIWEAGILPKDWTPIISLLRLYAYQHRRDNLTNQDVIHAYIRSARDMLPRYPSLSNNDQLFIPQYYQNSTLTQFEQTQNLLKQRLKAWSIYGANQETLESIATQYPPFRSQKVWPDGEPVSDQPDPSLFGDGTVPSQSAVLPFGTSHMVEGSHNNLPAIASDYILQTLYKKSVSMQVQKQKSAHLFVFDCPILVQLVLPTGEVVASNAADGTPVEVEESDDMLWMVAPDIPGTYKITVTALADTEVRAWVDSSDIQVFTLKKDESVQLTYSGEELNTNSEHVSTPVVLHTTPESSPGEPPLIFSFSALPTSLGKSSFSPLPAVALGPIPSTNSLNHVQEKQGSGDIAESTKNDRERPYVVLALLTIGLAILYRRQRE